MSTSGEGDSMENHGTPVDNRKNKVQCHYCEKVVSGFNRLKHHLGGVGSDVVACSKVPDDIREHLKNSLLEKKKERLAKEVGSLYHPDLPLRRNFFPSNEIGPRQAKLNTPAANPALESLASEAASPATSNEMGSRHFACQSQTPPLGNREIPVEPVLQDRAANGIGNSPAPFKIEEDLHLVVKEEAKDDDSALVASKCVGRFFYEAGIDLNTIKLPSFQRMIDAAISCGFSFRVPKYDEIKGWILEAELIEVQNHVEEVKSSWAKTGCSILLDCWRDQQGRSLISFLVDSPQGTIFLRSVDVSDAVRDVNALFILLSRVIEEVGVTNVVQVINHEPTCFMEAAGKKLVDKYKTIFWSMCADHCISLILDEIAALEHVEKVLTKAKAITRFIYSHILMVKLMKRHTQGRELVKTSKLKSVTPFITLKAMMSEKENLLKIFNSPTWQSSAWATKTKGKTICELVKSPCFWASAADILNVTNPLISVLHQINWSDRAPMGFLYDSMDRAKEEIKKNLQGEEAAYTPFWVIIDDIWDRYLHSPLHSAGYYLNPSLFYSKDFYCDSEVTSGLLFSLVHMIDDKQHQEMVVLQLDAYGAALGGFAEESAIHQRSTVPPALWWSLHGCHYPELQKLAIKILSQTCSTAARYKLRKVLSEQLHAKGRNNIAQQTYADLEFVHNNRRLWDPLYSKDQTDNFDIEDLNPAVEDQ